jgi:hypothetical protein
MKSVPQEEQRLHVPETFLHRTIQNLKEYVQGHTTELVFNLDEVDTSDWEGRKTKKIIVSVTIRRQTIVHGISGNVKHIWVIACVFHTEKSLISSIITLSDFASVREQLKTHGVGCGMYRG